MKNIIYFLYIFFAICIGLIIYLGFDSEARRTTLSKLTHAYNVYKVESVKNSVVDNNFSEAVKKLNSYIDISNALSSGKSSMHSGIYKAAYIAANSAVTQDQFNELEVFFARLVKLDPTLYEAKIWLARAVSDTNEKKAWNNIKKAIKLNPGREEAYREAIRLAHRKNDKILMKKYCNLYKKSQFGGVLTPNLQNFFQSSNLRKVAVEFLSSDNDFKIYPHSGIILNKNLQYEFIPERVINIKGFNIYLNFFPGVQITIDSVGVYTIDDKKSVDVDDLLISTKSSYILNENSKIILINTGRQNDTISISFGKEIKSVSKLIISMKVERLPLTNYRLCS
jgi:tetratricopeptide (TPR) repeat protein